jgi:hypothetical protein
MWLVLLVVLIMLWLLLLLVMGGVLAELNECNGLLTPSINSAQIASAIVLLGQERGHLGFLWGTKQFLT